LQLLEKNFIFEKMQPISLKQPFTNLQLELLSLYARNVSEEELLAIRDLLAQFFAEQATRKANKVWDEKKLDAKTLLKKQHRTPYRKHSS